MSQCAWRRKVRSALGYRMSKQDKIQEWLVRVCLIFSCLGWLLVLCAFIYCQLDQTVDEFSSIVRFGCFLSWMPYVFCVFMLSIILCIIHIISMFYQKRNIDSKCSISLAISLLYLIPAGTLWALITIQT